MIREASTVLGRTKKRRNASWHQGHARTEKESFLLSLNFQSTKMMNVHKALIHEGEDNELLLSNWENWQAIWISLALNETIEYQILLSSRCYVPSRKRKFNDMLLPRTISKSLNDIRSSNATFIESNTEKESDRGYLSYITDSVTCNFRKFCKTVPAITQTLFHIGLLA